jgi:hypothetical protein
MASTHVKEREKGREKGREEELFSTQPRARERERESQPNQNASLLRKVWLRRQIRKLGMNNG